MASIPELAEFPESFRIQVAQAAITEARYRISKGREYDLTKLAIDTIEILSITSLRNVQNLSGVILHTGLGRAPLRLENIQYQSANGYSNLEFDLATGKRGDRQDHVRHTLCQITGAEDAFVVNNAAGAVLLVLTALCSKKEVLLSRGQSVEIGGGFRMPDVIKASGCKLVDVGTTNKTRVQDFTDVVVPKTSAILQCHPSNFEVRGFVSSPSTSDLAKAAHECGVLFINDQGNGAIVDFSEYDIRGIETLPMSVKAGADITIGSGDKLLGGPQCGIILGRKDLIAKISKHPLARALRIDKSNLLLLQSTIWKYQRNAYHQIPLFEILDRPLPLIREWCETIAPEGSEIRETVTEIGSGAAPGQGVPSYAVVLKTKNAEELLQALRVYRIIGRIHRKAVWLDPRTADTIAHNYYVALSLGIDDRVTNDGKILKYQIARAWEQWK